MLTVLKVIDQRRREIDICTKACMVLIVALLLAAEWRAAENALLFLSSRRPVLRLAIKSIESRLVEWTSSPYRGANHEHVDGRLLSCGRPCPGIDIQIVDPSGKPVDTGKPGAVGARGANVMRGYGNNPKGNEHAFHERDVSHW